MTNANRLDALARLTGRQKHAVKDIHFAPEVISALKYPGKQR